MELRAWDPLFQASLSDVHFPGIAVVFSLTEKDLGHLICKL